MELAQQRDNFYLFWDDILEERVTINTLARGNTAITNYYHYGEIENLICPRELKTLVLSDVNDQDAIKAY